MNVLFVHNTFPEYREEFFSKISSLQNVYYLFTDIDLTKKIYTFESKNNYKDNIPYFIWEDINQVKGLIEKFSINVIVLPPCDNLKLYLISKQLFKLSKKYKIKLIYWNERWELIGTYKISFIKKIKNICHSLMIKDLCMKSDACIAAGTKSYNYLLSLGILKRNIKVAYDSSSLKIDSSYQNDTIDKLFEENKFIILYLGRLIPRKGCDILIKAFNNFSLKHENSVLLIGGSGDDDYIGLCKNLSNKKTFFLGPINTDCRYSIYLKSSVFVLPSIILNGVVEAWGLTVNESLQCGTPVIATNAVGSAYDLIDDNVGCIIKEGSVEDLEKALEKIYNSNVDYKTKCKLKYSHYSVENMAISFSSIIDGLGK